MSRGDDSSSDSSTDDERGAVPREYRYRRPSPKKRPKLADSVDDDTQPLATGRSKPSPTEPPAGQRPRDSIAHDDETQALVKLPDVSSEPHAQGADSIETADTNSVVSDASDEGPKRSRIAVPTLGLYSARQTLLSSAEVVQHAMRIVVTFLNAHPDVVLIVCEPDADVRTLWTGAAGTSELLESKRLVVLDCDPSSVRSKGGVNGLVDAAVCEVTWRTKAATDAAREMCELASKSTAEGPSTCESLMQDVKNRFPGGVSKVGYVVSVDVKVDAMLRWREGIRTLLFSCAALNATVDPKGKGKPIEDPVEVLKTSWLAVLSFFVRELADSTDEAQPGSLSSDKAVAASRNAFSLLMNAAKEKSGAFKTQSESVGLPAGGGGWGGGHSKKAYLHVLQKYIDQPEKYTQVEYHDDEVVLLRDEYPKSACHFLAMPRKLRIDKITELTKADIPLLEKMRAMSYKHLIRPNSKAHLQFIMGFHAVPSMYCLHMHVMSNDFRGPALKQKKHWNSFNTPFFRTLDSVIGELEQHGTVRINGKQCESWIKGPMTCPRHTAAGEFANMPRLQEHLREAH
ncbi:hypothetical protein DFJ74DRAFT_654884 [Hyaloraphidium curvatum]|nr:hypothetical protein DFJ74DRAFT_654884 [Hyaloraphidium curvatum]